MKREKLISNIIFLGISIISFISISVYLENSLGLNLTNPILIWPISLLALSIFFAQNIHSSNKYNRKLFIYINIYILWNIISIIRGIFEAETYWHWKSLISNIFPLMLPIITVIFIKPKILQITISNYLKILLPIFFLFLIFLIPSQTYGFYLIPITFLIFFLPDYQYRWIALIGLITIFILFSNLGARSNVIKFIIPYLILLLYPFKRWISKHQLFILCNILFIIPVLLFWLAISDVFNIFEIDQYIEGDYSEVKINSKGENEKEDLTADTRTFIYEEVLSTATKYNSWIIGRSPARGNETEWFGKEMIENFGVNERFKNEVAIVNIFTWTGVVGVFIYFMIFYQASFYAVTKSNNIYSKLIGVFIAFRWVYSWVEDVNNFDLNYGMLWILIGFGLSPYFRKMNDLEIKIWARGIFDKNYRNLNLKNTIEDSILISEK